MELDGLTDDDGLCDLDGLRELDGLWDGLGVPIVNFPDDVNVWIVYPPLVVMVPPVATNESVGYRMMIIPEPPEPPVLLFPNPVPPPPPPVFG